VNLRHTKKQLKLRKMQVGNLRWSLKGTPFEKKKLRTWWNYRGIGKQYHASGSTDSNRCTNPLVRSIRQP
jgi:hypothetical protein